MIRDRLVVGIKDKRLSEQLQLDPELTLDKAVTRIRQSELVKKQQDLLKNNFKCDSNPCNVDSIKAQGKHFRPAKQQGEKRTKWKNPKVDKEIRQCYRCGKTSSHSKLQCPASEVISAKRRGTVPEYAGQGLWEKFRLQVRRVM